MTNYRYINWKPDQGLEQQQAIVYNEANVYKFVPADANRIKKQFLERNIKPEHIRYAFHGDKMVGYVHARVQEQVKEIVISYPWTLPNTPIEVKATLFDDIIQLFQENNQYSDYQFRVNPWAKPNANMKFLQERGFKVTNTWKEVLLPLSEVAKADYNQKYTSRIGSERDIEALIILMKKDGTYTKELDTDEKIKAYITDNVVSTGPLILVYENDILTAACTPKEENNRVIMDFAVFKDVKDQESFIALFVELAKECVESGYGRNKPILVYTDNKDTPKEEQEFLKNFTPVQAKNLMHYCYLDNK